MPVSTGDTKVRSRPLLPGIAPGMRHQGQDNASVNVRTWSAPFEGAARNVFAIETEDGLVLVDAPLRRSDGAAAGAWLATLGRPVLGVLITHAHADHNFGLTQMLRGADVPIFATRAVVDAIRATEDLMQSLVPINFGEAETERDRLFPSVVVEPGVPVTIGGVPFIVADVGAVESAADSVWTSPALPGAVFSGDLVMDRTHLALLQGNSAGYRDAVAQLTAEAGPAATFFSGHGGLVPATATGRQVAYIDAYRAAVRDLAAGRPVLTEAEKDELVRRMRAVEPSPLLSFLIAMSADAVAAELAG